MSDELVMSDDTKRIYDIYEYLNPPKDSSFYDRDDDDLKYPAKKVQKNIALMEKIRVLFRYNGENNFVKNVEEVCDKTEDMVLKGQLDDFIGNVREIVKPVEKMQGIKNYVEAFFVSEQEACQNIHHTTNLAQVLKTHNVIRALTEHFQDDIIPTAKKLKV